MGITSNAQPLQTAATTNTNVATSPNNNPQSYCCQCGAAGGPYKLYCPQCMGSRETAQSGQWQKFVKTLTGKTIAVDMRSDSTVLDIKQQLSAKEGVAVENIRLIFAGKELENGRNCNDYNLNKDSTLHMVLQLNQQ